MKRFNWGYGLLLFFGFYISYLAITVIASIRVNHNLVVDNYYEHDIAFQERYFDVTTNRRSLAHDLEIVKIDSSESLNLMFGVHNTEINGIVQFYRPSDKDLDTKSTFKVLGDEDYHKIPIDQMQPGLWTIKVRWTDGDVEYYKEQSIVI